MAAKTGSAETGGAQDLVNGLFIEYAPANDPTIAFAGVIETAHHGADSVGYVGLSVLNQYFGLGNLNSPVAAYQGTVRAGQNSTPAPPEFPHGYFDFSPAGGAGQSLTPAPAQQQPAPQSQPAKQSQPASQPGGGRRLISEIRGKRSEAKI